MFKLKDYRVSFNNEKPNQQWESIELWDSKTFEDGYYQRNYE